MEVNVWIWYALEQMGDDRAASLRQELLRDDPPPLYREMLTSMS